MREAFLLFFDGEMTGSHITARNNKAHTARGEKGAFNERCVSCRASEDGTFFPYGSSLYCNFIAAGLASLSETVTPRGFRLCTS